MPTITIRMNEKVNRLVKIYQAAHQIATKEEAISKIIESAERDILNAVKR